MPRGSRLGGFWVAAATAAAFGLALTGFWKDLPYSPDVDEPLFVLPAVKMAATGDLNPHWFGHPGSTVMYPIAALVRVRHALVGDGTIQETWNADPSPFFVLGRLLMVALAVASVPLVYAVGRRVGPVAGLVASWLIATYPMVMQAAQVVRTDAGSLFFTTLALWLCLRVLERGTTAATLLAGGAIGVAIGTKYYLVALVGVQLAVSLAVATREGTARAALNLPLGLVAAVVGLFVSSPYLLLDFRAAVLSVEREFRSYHVGADALSPFGNFLWYVRSALPEAVGVPALLASLAGAILALVRRRLPDVVLVGFGVVFLIEICLSPLHWERWLLPILPVLAVLAGLAVERAAALVPRGGGWVAAGLAVTLAAGPASQAVQNGLMQRRPSTRVVAREWMLEHVAPGTHVAAEWYTAALVPADFSGYGSDRLSRLANFSVLERFSLGSGRTVSDYARNGFRYLVVSSAVYDRFLAAAERRPTEAAFYRELFASGHLLQEIIPTPTRPGPTIRVYELPAS
jgi:4-amino-4-deoxy-L-arabinose transferase-like glycosyltransferase